MVNRISKEKLDELMKLGENNPAAIQQVFKLFAKTITSDFDYINAIKKLNIKGVDLWLLYKNECNQNDNTFFETIYKKYSGS